jgi:outer membrane protein assembly factor BamA
MSLPRRVLCILLLCIAGCAHEPADGRPWVHSLTFRGNRTLSSGDLRDQILTEKTGWWPFAAKKYFDRAAFDKDLDRLKAYYANHGFFDVRIVTHEVKPRDHDSVDIVVQLDEGKPTHISGVQVVGLPPGEEKRATKIAKELGPGHRFDYQKYSDARQMLEWRLKEDGYAFAKVDSSAAVDRDEKKAWLYYKADSGPPVRFGKVQVEGNADAPAHAIENRVTFDEGDKYKPEDLGVTQGRIYALGVFSSVRLLLPDEPTETADIRIQLRPGKLHELKIGAGVAVENQRQEVRARGEWVVHNFLGGLRELRLRLRPAYVVLPDFTNPVSNGFAAENDITLKQPDIFATSITASAQAGYDLGISEGYQFHGPRGQLGLERPFVGNRLLVSTSWNLQYLNFFNIDPMVFNPQTTPLGFGFKNPYRLAYLEETAQFDLRNSALVTRYGGYALVKFEQGLPEVGGDFTYMKYTPEVRLFAPLGKRVVLAARGQFGWLSPSGNELESPITRRYNLGGPSSHRGFGFGRLSPQVIGMHGERVPIGGDAEMLLSFESRFNVMRVGGQWLGVTPFVDGGDVTARVGEIDAGNLHWATGGDIDYLTPVGVVRAGVGVRLNRLGPCPMTNPTCTPDPDDRIAFHLTIGEPF